MRKTLILLSAGLLVAACVIALPEGIHRDICPGMDAPCTLRPPARETAPFAATAQFTDEEYDLLMAGETHYEVLGVGRDADEDAIKDAYKAIAKKYHPDRSPRNRAQAEEAFKRIGEAYAVLRDADKKASYDKTLASAAVASHTPRNASVNDFGVGRHRRNDDDIYGPGVTIIEGPLWGPRRAVFYRPRPHLFHAFCGVSALRPPASQHNAAPGDRNPQVETITVAESYRLAPHLVAALTGTVKLSKLRQSLRI